MKKFKLGVLLIFSIYFVGCATPDIPGYIRSSVSEFDGAKEIVMEPAWVCKESGFLNCNIKLGLYRRSTMPENQIVLVAVVQDIKSFGEGKSLHFNIDGEIISFESIDTLTEFETKEGTYIPYSGLYIPPTSWSAKRYLIDKNFLDKILKAQRVAVRIDLRRSYVEGIFSRDAATLARPAFRDFYNEVFGNLQKEGK